MPLAGQGKDGDILIAFCMELRSSLDWSQRKGWTLPTVDGQPSCGAQLIFPSKQDIFENQLFAKCLLREEVERVVAPGDDSPLNASSTTSTGIGTYEDAKFKLEQCERGWIQDRARIRILEEHLEMSSAEIDHIVAQRVTDAIEAIAIYETKIRMAHDSVNQQQSKRNEVVRAHATGPGSKKAYAGKLPYYNRCKLHHVEPCTLKCGNCKRVGHMTRNCKALIASTSQRSHVANKKVVITCYECGGPCTVKCGNCKRVGHMTRNYKAPVASTSQRALVANKKVVITCYECGRQGHFRNECPKLSNQIQVNQNRKEKAHENTSTVADNANA
ncbi:reverse transcriptase domain-containing protein [Tanacetum coccineum]